MEGTSLDARDRRALAAVAAQFFVNGAMAASYVGRAPQIRDRIGVGVDTFGLLLTVGASVRVLSSLLAGRIIHTATTRRVLGTGAAVMVLALPLMGAARSPALWLVGMFVFACVDVLVDISMNLQGSWISARRHTPVMNRLHGLWSLGMFAGGAGALIANSVGLSPFAHLAIVSGSLAVGLVFVVRNLLPDDETAHAEEEEAGASLDDGRRRRLLPIVLLVLAGMFAVVAEVGGGDWATFRLTDDFGASGTLASAAFVAYAVGMTAMRFGGDWLQVRWGRMGLHRVSVGLVVTGFVLATLVDDSTVAVVGFGLVGIGVATFMPKLYDDAARLPGRRGAGIGALTAGMSVAFVVSPVAIGALAGTDLSVGAAIALFSLPCLAGLVLVSEWSARLLRRRPVPVGGPA